MDYKQKLEYQSNYWYNDGLKKAQIRDLSGAIVSLKRSLQFNRENITARNLLGLVYYGRGEVAEALVEWIISKNFRASENIASYYISKVQDNPSELEKVNQAVHKYNQCLGYCRQNGEDLAIIQLKKVVVAHPSFLKAYQLLALLYMHSGQYSKARQSLKTALKLDVTNDITLRYMHELNRQRNRQVAHIKEEKHGRQSVVTYNLGNETIIQPAATLRDNAAVMTVVNILIGMVVGAAVVWFLIAPAVINILNAVLDAKSRPGSGRSAAIAALWLLTTALYFVLSFATGAWHLTWILFLIAGAATGLVSAIYDWKK